MQKRGRYVYSQCDSRGVTAAAGRVRRQSGSNIHSIYVRVVIGIAGHYYYYWRCSIAPVDSARSLLFPQLCSCVMSRSSYTAFCLDQLVVCRFPHTVHRASWIRSCYVLVFNGVYVGRCVMRTRNCTAYATHFACLPLSPCLLVCIVCMRASLVCARNDACDYSGACLVRAWLPSFSGRALRHACVHARPHASGSAYVHYTFDPGRRASAPGCRSAWPTLRSEINLRYLTYLSGWMCGECGALSCYLLYSLKGRRRRRSADHQMVVNGIEFSPSRMEV